MLQRVDQGIGSGSVSEWGPASSGVVRSAPVHTTAGVPALVILKPVRTPVAILGSLGVCIYVPASRHWLISYSPIHLT